MDCLGCGLPIDGPPGKNVHGDEVAYHPYQSKCVEGLREQARRNDKNREQLIAIYEKTRDERDAALLQVSEAQEKYAKLAEDWRIISMENTIGPLWVSGWNEACHKIAESIRGRDDRIKSEKQKPENVGALCDGCDCRFVTSKGDDGGNYCVNCLDNRQAKKRKEGS